MASEAVESPGPLELAPQLFFSCRFNTYEIQFCARNLDNYSKISVIMGPNMKHIKKRKVTVGPKVEEINFDTAGREEWLTGFHKRKVQRAKHAAENAAKQYKEDKRNMRKKVRLFTVLAWGHLLICLDS